MRSHRGARGCLLLATCLAWVASAPRADAPSSEAPSVDTVLQRVLAARGGAQRWAALRTITIEGTWIAFSEEVPMTIRRARPDLYRFDHSVLGSPAVLAFDGEHAWVQGAALGAPEGQRLDDDWKRNILEDAPFAPRLIELAASGVPIALLGRQRVEGRESWVLGVEGGEGRPPETWYVDAQTWLETKRVSRVFDIFSGPGVELEMETYFMDYRDVAGIKIPFREERHFGTRYNVVQAQAVRLDEELDAEIFHVPPAAEEGDDRGGNDETESNGS